MYVGIFDIVQYDCPVVWLTEHVKDSNIMVVGANVAEIRKGYEKIYVVVLGDDITISRVLEKLNTIKRVKKYEVLQKKRKYVKIGMLISKTNTMEAAVDYDATPLTTWIAFNGFERWTLGFHTVRQLREFIKTVSEHDYIEKYRITELPEYILSLDYFNLFSLLNGSLDRITSKQAKLLETAMKLGYYEWPRKINVSLLARELGTSRVAIAKILRKAEKNVVELFLKILDSRTYIKNKLE
ncbi:MAG: helix-turn-helix domain-containing protein [Sulfolobales archaeon]|nr:helix-turn-helix domain-containing protein [Sulfolobales archaeon]MDW8083456.1 helix-turn-helix domain-containing protein [Sulfolobales archaeon]